MLLLSSNMPRLQDDAASDLVQPDGMSTHRWCADRPKLTACPRCHGVSGRTGECVRIRRHLLRTWYAVADVSCAIPRTTAGRPLGRFLSRWYLPTPESQTTLHTVRPLTHSMQTVPAHTRVF